MSGPGGQGWARPICTLVLLLLTGAAEPVLVPGVSRHVVEVNQDFNGAELQLFGAILPPPGARVGRDYDIVVVLEGPERPIVLRQKQRLAGVWVNADSITFQSAPGYYAMASTRPISHMVDAQTAAIYELGLGSLQLSPSGNGSGSIDPATQSRFAAGLVDLMARQGLYRQNEHGVTVTGQVLYQARITLPSSVTTGSYTAETFAISHGRVVASALDQVEVRKQGFARAIADFARRAAFSYGLLAVSLSVLMGWCAGRLFALI